MKNHFRFVISVVFVAALFLFPYAHAHAATLLEHWPFDGNSNATVTSTHNGTDTNIIYISGKFGSGAASSSGATPQIDTGNSYIDFATSSFAVSFWFKTNSITSCCTLLGGRTIAQNTKSWEVRAAGGGQYDMVITDPNISGIQDIAQYVNTGFTDGNWHFVVGQRTATSVQLWIDNTLRATSTNNFRDVTTSLNLKFFTTSSILDPWYYHGALDEVWLFSGDLTQSEMLSLYNQNSPTSQAPSLSQLQQFKSDATSTIQEGDTTTEDTVVLGATLQSSSTDQLYLEVQASSTESATVYDATSSPVGSGIFATTSLQLLPDGHYHWQARAVDASTTVASAWQSHSTTSTTDFVVHQVPLYTQRESNFPSLNATQDWASKQYGNGKYSCRDSLENGSSTIRSCGCAISSLVMASRYYGVSNDLNNDPVDPGDFNAWLTSVSATGSKIGYTGDGGVWRASIDQYTNGQVLFNNVVTGTTPFLTQRLNTELANLRPTLLYEPSVRQGHYIVADSQLATTYHIRDPYFYNTYYLTSGSNTTSTHNYSNSFNSLRTFRQGTIGVIPISISFALASPAELLVTDSIGRRLGIDPVANVSYDEIPDSSYFTDSIGGGPDDSTSTGHEVKMVWIPFPISGTYNMQVIGTASGTYTFSGLSYDASGMPHMQEFDGSTQNGLITPYALNFTPQSSSSIILASQIIFGGFLDPVKADGTGIYKLGRTLPIKFQLTNASGTILTNHTAQLFVAKVQDDVVGTDEIPLSTSNADTGNYFRISEDEYIYNLNTGVLSPGTWQLKVVLDDGTNYTVLVSMKN